jgi:gamma-glutamylcyclotransferase (GGCT)/AIG2-like uncharacterized protein YtfP
VKLFVYGTLRFPEVLAAVAQIAAAAAPAMLPGFERRAVRGEVYPAVVPRSGASVEGLLLAGVPRARLPLLDAFEGREYRRQAHEVHLANGRRHVAWCYVWAPACARELASGIWDMDAFERDALHDYLRRCRRLGHGYRRGRLGAGARVRRGSR